MNKKKTEHIFITNSCVSAFLFIILYKNKNESGGRTISVIVDVNDVSITTLSIYSKMNKISIYSSQIRNILGRAELLTGFFSKVNNKIGIINNDR